MRKSRCLRALCRRLRQKKGGYGEQANSFFSAYQRGKVEISMLLNVIAATNDIEGEDLGKLRHACIEEVRRINGSVSLDNAIEWQK